MIKIYIEIIASPTPITNRGSHYSVDLALLFASLIDFAFVQFVNQPSFACLDVYALVTRACCRNRDSAQNVGVGCWRIVSRIKRCVRDLVTWKHLDLFRSYYSLRIRDSSRCNNWIVFLF